MEPLITFADKEVLEDLQPSNWVRITLSKSAEPAPREHSHSRTKRAQLEGCFQQFMVKDI